MKIRASKTSRGFTLLEIMVALFLLGMLVAAVYSSWMAIMRGSETGRRAAARVQRSRIAIRTLEDSLTCARSFQTDLEHYSFEAENGNDAMLTFVSRLSKSFPRSGKFGDFDVRRLTFSLEQAADLTPQLVMRQNPILTDMDEDEKNFPIVLAKDVKKFEMEFWDTKKGEWLDEWTETNALPKLIKVTLAIGGGTPQSTLLDEVTRVIAIPAGTVPANWQGGPGGGGPPNPIPNPGPGGNPGIPTPGPVPNPNPMRRGF